MNRKITLPAASVEKAGATKGVLYLLSEDGNLSVVKVHEYSEDKNQIQAELLFTTLENGAELHKSECLYYLNATEARRESVMMAYDSIQKKGVFDTSVIDAVLEMPTFDLNASQTSLST